MWRTILIYSVLILCLLILFRISRATYLLGGNSWDLTLAGIALVFLLLGIFLSRGRKSKTETTEPDSRKIEQLGLSTREYEVLLQVCKGQSNQEIATTLFISESTVKTHVSNLLVKLDVRRRTQLMTKARNLNLIPG
ncbi:regulatory protein, luxR family [Robiginitalea myxolifaciens]|uniref:Regulatory protein, luxR family n=1 Tax=Robiginitalea myxolifaciens TaxID=400055 RepID=A0A1I6FWP9_9FLAO|nr:response regulator transcription factor [Robiginitalea myxolifaciens]SFR34373.1 regulatory protein, luxR family [Robiginitalea myxolifaciens]